jgi:hypothetical protein
MSQKRGLVSIMSEMFCISEHPKILMDFLVSNGTYLARARWAMTSTKHCFCGPTLKTR